DRYRTAAGLESGGHLRRHLDLEGQIHLVAAPVHLSPHQYRNGISALADVKVVVFQLLFNSRIFHLDFATVKLHVHVDYDLASTRACDSDRGSGGLYIEIARTAKRKLFGEVRICSVLRGKGRNLQGKQKDNRKSEGCFHSFHGSEICQDGGSGSSLSTIVPPNNGAGALPTASFLPLTDPARTLSFGFELDPRGARNDLKWYKIHEGIIGWPTQKPFGAER